MVENALLDGERKRVEECARSIGFENILHAGTITKSSIFDQYLMHELYTLEKDLAR